MNPYQQLELFLERAEELGNTRVVRSNFNPKLTFQYDYHVGHAMGTTQPDEEYFRSFLTVLRRFISSRSPVFLYKVFNICQKTIISDWIKEHITDARAKWTQQLKNDGFRFVVNGKELSPENLTDLWINARYFHDDEDKRKTLEAMGPEGFIISRHKFLVHVLEASRYVLYVARMVKIAKREGFIRA